jgi:serine/threonine-protein kinase HipA
LSAHATTPASSRIQLVDRLLYNLILGNNDAHAKNFALLHQPTGIFELSPAYDLVCTEMYPSLSPNFAMSIGTATALKNLSAPVWKAFARDIGIGFPLLRQRGVELCRKVEKSLDESFALVMRGNPALARDIYPLRRRADFFRKLSKLVTGNSKKLTRSLG